jgi:hypothetical protein
MDLNDITVQDFKNQFWRVFPFLPEYDNTKLYNAGIRVYYPPTELFYDCTVNGTQGILPTDTDNWVFVTGDSIENYVLDSDVEAAFAEAKVTFNQSLFSTDDEIKLGFLYLAAHYLSNDLKAAMGGATGGGFAGLLTSRSVGNVAESYGIPQAYMNDPILSFLTGSPFGLKYLSMVLPLLRGNVRVVCGRTLP